ncbi:MAG: molybdopterin-binding protein [Eubacteriales bacterium]|nr:molybdopterin-binding protein [Eubacteriales bacterium]
MKCIRVEDAVGQVLCHDMTQIIKGEFKGPRFRKGHVVTEEDIPVLLSMGKENIYVWEVKEGILHENDAAERLCALCLNDNMERSEVKEGKIELTAGIDGLFRINSEKLIEINSIDEIMIATRKGNMPVQKGDKLCGTRVIPLVIDEQKLIEAEKAAGGQPIMELHPYKLKKCGVITTGSEVFHGRIEDTFTPVIEAKLQKYGITMTEHVYCDDGMDNITAAIADMRSRDIDMILCTGGMSVDPDDNTPGSIKKSGARIVTYGAPVLPGAMFLLGYYEDGMPIMGLPGCVMYAAATIFDLALPVIAAGVEMTKRDFVVMGEGGLCLGCKPCHFPNCPFGK